MSSTRDALEPTLAQGPSSPELVDLEVPSVPSSDDDPQSRYESGDVLGEGGMGEVRVCRDLRIGRKVAVKRLKQGLGSRSDARARFLREARVQGQLEHPAIVPVYDLGRTPEGVEYFTMKRVRGETLADVLADGKHSLRKLLTAYSSVCLAVHYAHMRGVLHRDLKPANVMLGDFGEVYVLDWGLAKVTGAPDPAMDQIIDTSSSEDLRTQAGFILGTPGYIAPEVLEGAEPDPRSDVYALGAILFEIIAGEPLRPGKTPQQRLAATLEGSERRPSREAAPELVALCLRATARDPSARLASARDLHEEVERYLDGDDLALRREAAERHAGAAREAFERALGEGDDSTAARQRALQEVGLAIALDPDNPSAKTTLLDLLMTPPRVVPEDAVRELQSYEETGLRTYARLGAASYAAFFLFVPFLFWIGVKSWGCLVLASTLIGLASAVSLAASYAEKPGRIHRYGPLILSAAAIASFTSVWGPYVVVPGLIALNAVGYAMRPKSYRPVVVGLVSCLAILIPLVLEWTGVLLPSASFSGGQIHILPRYVAMPELATQVFLLVATLATVVAGVLYAWHTHAATGDAEERLILHLWQLRQLVPEDAHHAVRAPSSAVLTHGRCPIF
jgi:eukaryotic-like serine/threonine-protein kinase